MSVHDVAVIGCGVTGAFIARALSRCRIRTVVIERGPDACSGTSRANSGVVHAGFYSMPGTLKAELCVEGNRRYAAL
ncbi:MAG TPA: FAD-dependent oxidoreductase, partial [Thermoplasmata archaeon]|nr:FAD-dependent oxidoreductase [Thermoplasmata archaeon]